MRYFIAINENKQILSLIFVGRKPSVIRSFYSNINKRKCVYYSEYELKRIEFPEKVTFEEIDPNIFGGCKLIPKAEEEEAQLLELQNKMFNKQINSIDCQNDLLNGEKDNK
jgi:hypothetical protein